MNHNLIRKAIGSLGLAAIIMASAFAAPQNALADGQVSAQSVFLGTVATRAVTAPILIGGILYVPCDCGGSATPFLGTIETNAVTAPILIGGILYVPPGMSS